MQTGVLEVVRRSWPRPGNTMCKCLMKILWECFGNTLETLCFYYCYLEIGILCVSNWWKTVGILWKYYENTMGKLWKYYVDTMKILILWKCHEDNMGILWKYFGNAWEYYAILNMWMICDCAISSTKLSWSSSRDWTDSWDEDSWMEVTCSDNNQPTSPPGEPCTLVVLEDS